MYYDGCSMVVVNGDVVAQGGQFSLQEVVQCCETIVLLFCPLIEFGVGLFCC